MTLLDEAPERTSLRSKRPRIIWVFAALAVLFFLIGGVGGSYQGKLQNVQKNENSAFLPGSARRRKSPTRRQTSAASNPSRASSSTSATEA